MEKSIVLSIRFTGLLPQKKTIDFFSTQFKKQFNKTISNLNYTILDKTKNSWKIKSKSVKYTEKNIKKYSDLISSIEDKVQIDFELIRNLEDANNKHSDIDFSIIYNISDKINSINIILNNSIYNKIEWKSFIEIIIRYLIKQGCVICNGFVINLENKKNPSFYVAGIGNGGLDKKEEEKLNLWSNNITICTDKVWDIFWGNIISTNDCEILNTIKSIVDKDNFLQLASNVVWFNIKEPLKDFDIMKYSTERIKLYNYFKLNGLIMV